jgi:hypothetical protein
LLPIVISSALACAAAGPPELVEVRRIWDAAPHNAFTDLVRHHGRWYCVFREGTAHVSPDGKLRVLVSPNGTEWASAALLSSPLGDLRDAKIVITPAGRLLLNGAVAIAQPADKRHQSLAWFSDDGRRWSDAISVGDPDFWLWRTTWCKGVAYGIGYLTNPDRNQRVIRLYSSKDGARFETLVPDLQVRGSPGETAIRFRKDGTALCLLRRDPYSGQPPIPESAATAMLGTASAPYKEWQWKDLGVRIGGPNFIEIPGRRYVAVVRLHDGKVRTALCWLDPDAGSLREFLPLPSAGDSSYAGLVWHDGLLWISYYSSHEGKTSIYLAIVRIP